MATCVRREHRQALVTEPSRAGRGRVAASTERSFDSAAWAWTAAVAVLIAVGCGGTPERLESGVRLRSESIGHLGSGYRAGSLIVSPDHRHFAWVDERGGRCRVVADRVRGSYFVRCADPKYSPDGETLAFYAATERANPPKVRLVVNGTPSDVVVGDEGPIVFGAKSGAWAAAAPAWIEPPKPPPAPSAGAGPVATNAGATTGDGSASPAASAASAPSPVPSEAAAEPPHRVVVFNQAGVLGEHEDTTVPTVSADGRHVAYIAADEGRTALYVDGKIRREFGAPEVAHHPAIKLSKPGPNLEPETTVRYLSDGSLAGVALAEGGWTVFHDDDVWAAYPALRMPPESSFQIDSPDQRESSAIVAGSFTVAEDSPTACWWERLEGVNNRWRVLCNGKPVDEQVCEVQSPGVPISIAAKTGKVAYLCRSTPSELTELANAPKNIWVVVNGEKHGPHRFVWGLSISEGGEHYGYAAADSSDEPWFYVIDGRRHEGPWQQTFPPKFSPDGTVAVWAASAEEDGSRVDLVLRGNIVTRAEMIMKPPLFRGSGADMEVQWAVKRGRSVRRVIASGIGPTPIPAAPAPSASASEAASLDSPRPPV